MCLWPSVLVMKVPCIYQPILKTLLTVHTVQSTPSLLTSQWTFTLSQGVCVCVCIRASKRAPADIGASSNVSPACPQRCHTLPARACPSKTSMWTGGPAWSCSRPIWWKRAGWRRRPPCGSSTREPPSSARRNACWKWKPPSQVKRTFFCCPNGSNFRAPQVRPAWTPARQRPGLFCCVEPQPVWQIHPVSDVAAALPDMWLSLGIQPSTLMPLDYFYLLLRCAFCPTLSIFSFILSAFSLPFIQKGFSPMASVCFSSAGQSEKKVAQCWKD